MCEGVKQKSKYYVCSLIIFLLLTFSFNFFLISIYSEINIIVPIKIPRASRNGFSIRSYFLDNCIRISVAAKIEIDAEMAPVAISLVSGSIKDILFILLCRSSSANKKNKASMKLKMIVDSKVTHKIIINVFIFIINNIFLSPLHSSFDQQPKH